MSEQRNRGGRPRLNWDQKQRASLDVRLKIAEKTAFEDAAELAGLPLSTWVRERLRAAAMDELENARRPVAFLPKTKSWQF